MIRSHAGGADGRAYPSIRISYGDYHYEVNVDEFDRERLKMQVLSHMYKALMDFHGSRHDEVTTVTQLKKGIYELAADRPDLIHELKERGLL